MKTLLTITALAFLSTGASAGLAESTFDKGCFVNWKNGGCGTISIKGPLHITQGSKIVETKK